MEAKRGLEWKLEIGATETEGTVRITIATDGGESTFEFGAGDATKLSNALIVAAEKARFVHASSGLRQGDRQKS